VSTEQGGDGSAWASCSWAFQNAADGLAIFVIAALFALRATNVRVVDMAPGAEDNQALQLAVAVSNPAPTPST
jgi:hypothetical protein